MNEPRPPSWKWTVCGLLLLATMLNYMDRQTLSQLAKTICDEYSLSNQQYGDLEMGFGFAFAAGALCFGFIVDRFGALWLYPLVLIGWSLAGIATAYADAIGASLLAVFDSQSLDETHSTKAAYLGFLTCRVALGFFEAGHWPCALVTTQTILSRDERSLGNSILQSGAALGAIVTPRIVLAMIRTHVGPEGDTVVDPGGWRPPFVAIGVIGMIWIVPWLMMVRSRDLIRPVETETPADNHANDAPPESFWRPFLVLVVGVIMINATWQFFRAWLPKFLEEQHRYTLDQVGWFVTGYYVATDIGCITAGIVPKWLASKGWTIHRARLTTFGVCALLTTLSVYAAFLQAGPLLVILFLVMGAGALGLFPNYYSFTQELSRRHQGKIVGILGAIGWIGTSPLQPLAGRVIDHMKTTNPDQAYTPVIVVAGLLPLVAFAALWLFWEKPAPASANRETPG